MPKVSVIMNCFNGERYLKEALESVFAQTFKDWEVIFWDNGSTDNSAEIAKSYGEKVRYFRNEKTVPIGSARNNAFKQARGEYIAILDVDDVWLPEKLERQIPLFESNPKVGLVFCNAIYFDEKGYLFKSFDIASPKRGRVFGALLRKNFTTSATLVYRKRFLDEFPYLYIEEELYASEDFALLLRCAFHHQFDYVDVPLAKRRVGSGVSEKYRFLFAREMLKIFNKLREELPDIEINYKKEVACFMAFCHYDFALEEWSKENVSNARKYLLLSWNDVRCLAVYLCTWLFPSVEVFDNIKNRVNRIRYGLLKRISNKVY